MSGWLLDTNVISMFAPGKAAVPAQLAAWLEAHNDEFYLSTLTATEITRGVAKLRRGGARARALALTEWFELIMTAYGDRVLVFDLPAARLAGDLMDVATGRGHAPDFADAAIAGIAKANTLTILTFNLRHFDPLGVDALSPLDASRRP